MHKKRSSFHRAGRKRNKSNKQACLFLWAPALSHMARLREVWDNYKHHSELVFRRRLRMTSGKARTQKKQTNTRHNKGGFQLTALRGSGLIRQRVCSPVHLQRCGGEPTCLLSFWSWDRWTPSFLGSKVSSRSDSKMLWVMSTFWNVLVPVNLKTR